MVSRLFLFRSLICRFLRRMILPSGILYSRGLFCGSGGVLFQNGKDSVAVKVVAQLPGGNGLRPVRAVLWVKADDMVVVFHIFPLLVTGVKKASRKTSLLLVCCGKTPTR